VDSHLEVIDAFVDGERVDAASLKQALADPDGRDYFVDAWTLRDAVQHDPEIAVPEGRSAAAKRPAAAGRWMIAAGLAAGLVAGVTGGYMAGLQRSPSSAPVPPATPTAVARPVPARDVFPAPAPTRVIQLEFRIDSSGNGGD
jgi:hypothetical protein